MIKTKEERFQTLYWKYRDLIIHIANNRLKDYYCAQDVCQETFMKMFRTLDMSQSDEKVKAWLIVAADNLAKDIMKKGGKYRQADAPNLEAVEIMERTCAKVSGNEYFDEIVRREFRSKILEGLHEANREQYEIILLVCCLQMSITDVAECMHMTYEQVSMNLHRARTWIRKNYRTEYLELKY